VSIGRRRLLTSINVNFNSELRRLRQLDEENRKLKQLVADLSLDKAMLQDALQKSSETGTAQSAGRSPAEDLWREHTSLLRCPPIVLDGLVLPPQPSGARCAADQTHARDRRRAGSIHDLGNKSECP
jgi:hypothetical protein